MKTTNFRKAGAVILIGAIIMLAGAIVWQAAGADLDAALATEGIPAYLELLGNVRHLIILNLSFWTLGVFLMGVGGFMLSNLSRQNYLPSQFAKFCFITAVPMAIVSFVGMATIAALIAPDTQPMSVEITEAIGWFSSRTDWFATILIVGLGPAFLSSAGSRIWAPRWLSFWGYICAIAGVLTLVSIYIGGLTTYGFLIVPVGLGWMIAAGIVLLRLPPELSGIEVKTV